MLCLNFAGNTSMKWSEDTASSKLKCKGNGCIIMPGERIIRKHEIDHSQDANNSSVYCEECGKEYQLELKARSISMLVLFSIASLILIYSYKSANGMEFFWGIVIAIHFLILAPVPVYEIVKSMLK